MLVAEYEMEFEGAAVYWNECLRPIFGGPEAKETAVVKSEPAPETSAHENGERTDASGATPKKAAKAAKKPAAKRRKSSPAAKPAGKRTAKSTAKSTAKPAAKPEAIAAHGPATDTRLLYEDLAKVGGRRAEKDAILATVWLLGGSQHDVTFDAVARHLHAIDIFREVRVKPHLLKHCSRSHMLEPGPERETVRLTKKGMRYIADLMRG